MDTLFLTCYKLAIENLNEPLLNNLLKDMVMLMEMDYVQDYRAQEKPIRSNLKDAKDKGLAEGEKINN